jgi:hypothetical protein
MIRSVEMVPLLLKPRYLMIICILELKTVALTDCNMLTNIRWGSSSKELSLKAHWLAVLHIPRLFSLEGMFCLK